MQYTKRTYKEVRDSFEWEYSGKSLWIKWTTVGVNSLGIWLQPYTNDQPYGFFEWKWIKEILISERDNLIYFVMYDMDAVYNNVVLWFPRIAFKIAINKLLNGDKAISYPYRNDALAAVMYASDQNWANVISIE
jgi:hypothetical protein